MNSQPLTSRDEDFAKLYARYGLNSPFVRESIIQGKFHCNNLVIYDDIELPNNKEETPMKKHFTFAGSSAKYDTRTDAEKAAKKYMDSCNRNYGMNSDIAIYEAVACLTFPIPAYEVVELAAAAS